jgi:hypothetical protein
MSLAGVPRIQNGLEFVERFTPSILLHGLVDGATANRILLEVVRTLCEDRPSDLEIAFDRLHDLQTYLSNTTSPGVVPLERSELEMAFASALEVLRSATPWTGPAARKALRKRPRFTRARK